MCDSCTSTGPAISRRRFGLATATGVVGLASLRVGPAKASARMPTRTPVPQPEILPREAWARGREPRGEIPTEDPKFLLVHHTAEPGNDYGADDVSQLLQGIFEYHTGSAKGWPDVAYNFFIDHDGRIWEGRQGSLAGPVRGSATGGNQGWSQLCCFLGNFEAELPSQRAQDSMVALLAWLGDRYAIDTSPGATVEIESLGSNRWPAGTVIPASTIAGHRDMSMTSCPGDSAYAWVTGSLPASVTAVRAATGVPTSTTSSAPSTTASPTTAPDPPPSDSADRTTDIDTTTSAVAPTAGVDTTGTSDRSGGTSRADGSGPAKLALATGAVLATGAGAFGLVRARRRHDDERCSGSHWVLTALPTRDPSSRDPNGPGETARSRRDRSTPGSGHPDHAPAIGTDGPIAWIIDGGWPTEAVEAAVADLGSVVESAGLRSVGSELVGRLGTSPDGAATVVLFLAPLGGSEPVLHVLGVGRGQIAVRGSTGSRLLSCPIEAELEWGSSMLVRLGDGATEVRVEPTSAGRDAP